MPNITPDDIHNIHDFDTLLDFLREKLGWHIPEDVELEDIAFPWSPEDLDLDELTEEQIPDCWQLLPFPTSQPTFEFVENTQPWGIFFLQFDSELVYRTALRRVLRGLVERRDRDANLPTWKHDHLLWCVGLSIFIGCGDTEDADSIVIPDELYDTSELTYEISDAEIQELMALEVPTNWEQTRDRELRAKYYHAHLLQQFGNIPAVHIVAERERERALTGVIVFTTTDEMVDFDKAQYVLWPTKLNRDKLERSLKIKMRRETDDPELFAKIYREELIEQHGDIPEVDVVVEGETKLWFGGFRFPGDEDEYIVFLEAKYVLWPEALKLQRIEKYRKARAEGTPFHLVDLDSQCTQA